MGNMNQCQCVNLVQDMQQCTYQEAIQKYKDGELKESEYLLMMKIVKIQSLIRRFLVRCRIEEIREAQAERTVEGYNKKVEKMLEEFTQQHFGRLKLAPFVFGEYSEDAQKAEEYLQREFMQPALQDNGNVYIGEVVGGNKWGKGIQMWKDGRIYVGFWWNNKFQGKGRLVYVNGDVYEGEWKHHKCNGFGVYLHKDGAQYQGLWVDDHQHGSGIQKWSDGSQYEGCYQKGEKEGEGVFRWPDGSVYKGQFHHNHLEGLGLYSWPDGRLYHGQWKADRMHGQGYFISKDNKQYFGQFYNDKKHGVGAMLFPDSRQYYGYFQDNKQHGKAILISQTGAKRYGEWTKGERDRWVIFTDDLHFKQLETFITAFHSVTNPFQQDFNANYDALVPLILTPIQVDHPNNHLKEQNISQNINKQPQQQSHNNNHNSKDLYANKKQLTAFQQSEQNIKMMNQLYNN